MSVIIEGFAAWHPTHGFDAPQRYEGAIVFVRSDDPALYDDVREMNRDARQTNRTGWRIVPVTVTRKDQP